MLELGTTVLTRRGMPHLLDTKLSPVGIFGCVCFHDDEAVLLLHAGHPRSHLGAVEGHLQAVADLREPNVKHLPRDDGALVALRLFQAPFQRVAQSAWRIA